MRRLRLFVVSRLKRSLQKRPTQWPQCRDLWLWSELLAIVALHQPKWGNRPLLTIVILPRPPVKTTRLTLKNVITTWSKMGVGATRKADFCILLSSQNSKVGFFSLYHFLLGFATSILAVISVFWLLENSKNDKFSVFCCLQWIFSAFLSFFLTLINRYFLSCYPIHYAKSFLLS